MQGVSAKCCIIRSIVKKIIQLGLLCVIAASIWVCFFSCYLIFAVDKFHMKKEKLDEFMFVKDEDDETLQALKTDYQRAFITVDEKAKLLQERKKNWI